MMSEQEKILSKLKEKIQTIRKRIREIIEQQQNNIRVLKKLDEKYGYVEQAINIDLPSNPEHIAFLQSLDSTMAFVQEKANQWYVTKIPDDPQFYCINTSGTNIAASLATYPSFNPFIPSTLKQAMNKQMSDDHEAKKDKISEFLNKLSPHLKKTYLGAYENLDICVRDPERGAIALMREIIDQVLKTLAPDEEIKKMPWYTPDTTSRTGIIRAHRVRYIAEFKAQNESFRDLILKNTSIFNETVNALSKYHKRGDLDLEEARGFFFQAESLIEIICAKN